MSYRGELGQQLFDPRKFAPDGKSGGEELNTATSEGFEGILFYDTLNRYHIKKYAPEVESDLDLGSGTGSGIEYMILEGKYVGSFYVVGTDINEHDLTKAKARFGAIHNGRISFVKADATHLPFKDNQFKLVKGLNFAHLLKDQQPKLFEEAHRVGETFLMSTAYAKGIGIKDRPMLKDWLTILMSSREIARELLSEMGLEFLIGETPDLMKYTKEGYEGMAREAGFHRVQTEEYIAEIPREQAKRLVAVPEFAMGALPLKGDPKVMLPIAQEALRQSVDRIPGSGAIRRGWLLGRFDKKSA